MPGVEYFYGRFDLLFDTTANDVSFYRIDYRNSRVRMKFVDNRRNGGSNRKTSYVAGKYDAVFGVNGMGCERNPSVCRDCQKRGSWGRIGVQTGTNPGQHLRSKKSWYFRLSLPLR